MAKMRVQGSRVIISGHETTKEECNAVTLMCDEMAKSKDFRLVEYRPGYAEFEAVGQAEDLKFAPNKVTCNLYFTSGITQVVFEGNPNVSNNTQTITTSGTAVTVVWASSTGTQNTATATVAEGYNFARWEVRTPSGDVTTTQDSPDASSLPEGTLVIKIAS